jgi:hypothetical protein
MIDHVDLYGGEVLLLPDVYLERLISTIREKYTGSINIITNLSCTRSILFDPSITLSVSFDFDCREQSDKVWRNIQLINKNVHILMLASPCLMEKNVDTMISILNTQRNIKTVEIKPYSPNRANVLPTSVEEYEAFVKQWITSPVTKHFKFINETLLRDSINHTYNAFSDNHIYVTPAGEMAVLDFTNQNTEYFKIVETLDEYIEWTRMEKSHVQTSSVCGSCEYLGNCNTEHYRNVTKLTPSCDGHLQLIRWFKTYDMESAPDPISHTD